MFFIVVDFHFHPTWIVPFPHSRISTRTHSILRFGWNQNTRNNIAGETADNSNKNSLLFLLSTDDHPCISNNQSAGRRFACASSAKDIHKITARVTAWPGNRSTAITSEISSTITQIDVMRIQWLLSKWKWNRFLI